MHSSIEQQFSLLFRVNAAEKVFQDEKDAKLFEWRKKLASVEAFLSGQKEKLEDGGGGSDVDLETVMRQRHEMEVRLIKVFLLYELPYLINMFDVP